MGLGMLMAFAAMADARRRQLQTIGEHTQKVLTELGLDARNLTALSSQGVVLSPRLPHSASRQPKANWDSDQKSAFRVTWKLRGVW
jgi:hypothetical protein